MLGRGMINNSEQPGEYYLSHFSTEDRKWSSITDGIYNVIKRTNLRETWQP